MLEETCNCVCVSSKNANTSWAAGVAVAPVAQDYNVTSPKPRGFLSANLMKNWDVDYLWYLVYKFGLPENSTVNSNPMDNRNTCSCQVTKLIATAYVFPVLSCATRGPVLRSDWECRAVPWLVNLLGFPRDTMFQPKTLSKFSRISPTHHSRPAASPRHQHNCQHRGTLKFTSFISTLMWLQLCAV